MARARKDFIMDLDNLDDTRKSTLVDEDKKSIPCEEKIKKAVSNAIYKVFPKDLENIKRTLEQYDQAIKSNVLTRFDYFDFKELDKKMKKIEEIDIQIKSVAYGVKELVEDINFNKDNIEKSAKKWMEKIENKGIRNLNAQNVVGSEIDNLKDQIEDIKKNKNNIFSLTNILLLAVAAATALNSYYIFY